MKNHLDNRRDGREHAISVRPREQSTFASLFPQPLDPVLWASKTAGSWKVDAPADVLLGHVLTGPPGSTDDGIFLRWWADGESAEIGNDRYGIYPAFVYQYGGDFAVSPSLEKLVAQGADTTLDEQALAVFLRLGQFVGDDTPFRHIRTLEPNSRIKLAAGELDHSHSRAQGRFTDLVAADDAADQYAVLFSAAMARRLACADRFIIPLSGGRDSRHILFEAVRQGRPPEACLTVDEWPDDTEVACNVARATECHAVVAQPPVDLARAEARRNELTSFMIDEGVWPLAVVDHIAAQHCTTLFDGIGGDMLSNALMLTAERLRLFRSGNLRLMAADLLPDVEAMLAKLLDRNVLARASRDVALARLEKEVQGHLDCGNPVTSFFFWNRTRRRISAVPYGMLRNVPQVFAPYLDHAVYDFLVSLTPDTMLDRKFHDLTIARTFPQWAGLDYERKDRQDYDRSGAFAAATRSVARQMLGQRLHGAFAASSIRLRMVAAMFSSNRANAYYGLARRLIYLDQLLALQARGTA